MNYLIENQKVKDRIVSVKEGVHQLIAPAGAGKSSTIIARIVSILKERPNAKIIAFAFNNFASEQLNFRLKTVLEKEGMALLSKNVFIGTIHQFCFDYLKHFIPHFSDYVILDNMTRFAFVSKKAIYNSLELFNLPKLNLPHYNKTRQNTRRVQTVNIFLKSADIVREEDNDVVLLSSSTEFINSYNKYISLLDKNNFFDFSGILYKFVSELKTNLDFKLSILESFDYLIVDEYQDINNIQEELIKLLGEKSNLLVVGDEDQTIYQFRGSNINHFLTFHNRYGKVEKHLYKINYRSSDSIVKLGENLIKNNKNRSDKVIHSNPNNLVIAEQGDVILRCFDDDNDEIIAIGNDIKNKLNLDYTNSKNEQYCLSYSDFCILVRTNSSAKRISEILAKEGIPFVSSNPGLLLNQREIKLIIDCLFFVFDLLPGMGEYVEDSPLIRMYQDIFDIDTFDDKHFSDIYFMEGYETIFNYYSSTEFYFNLVNLRDSYTKIKTFELQKIYHNILAVFGSEHYDFEENQLYNFSKFSTVITSFEINYPQPKKSDIFQFIEFLWGYVMENTEIGGFEKEDRSQKAVNIVTIHKAKGLEFPVVYIPHLINRIFPSTGHRPVLYLKEDLAFLENYKGNIEDERRLFYVAITRSEKFLWFSYSKVINGLKSTPSDFINELDTNFISDEDLTIRNKNTYPIRTELDTLVTNQGDLRYYIQCPYNYYLRNIVGFDPFVPITYGYGEQIHKLIDLIHKRFTSTIPNNTDIITLVNSEFFLRFSSGDLYEKLKKSAINLISSYVDNNSKLFSLDTNTEIQFEYFIDDSIVKGSIDIITKEDGKSVLMDIKTDEETDFSKYIDQVRIYTLACRDSLGVNIDKAYIYEIKENKRHEINIEKDFLDESKSNYTIVIDKIKQKDFTPKPSKECKDCDMRMLCRYKA